MWDLWWTKWHWAGFLRVLRFPLPIFSPPVAPQSPSSIIWGWYNRPVVAAVASGLSLTPLIIIIIIIIIIIMKAKYIEREPVCNVSDKVLNLEVEPETCGCHFPQHVA
jgi:hypothetical protein